ncbi:MAG: hypothetical protein MRERV_1c031 [Mycoplasmataceae bacterium RV_VA103A]|nr:MAG: hypothetical protein MRERV_1c031 [Mycoplasmataceae bacterium RV_VA103A]
MFKYQKTVFSKLYRYYCAKLVEKIPVVLLYFAFFAFIWISLLIRPEIFQKLFGWADTWQRKLIIFWAISFFQFGGLCMTIIPLVSYLVGRGLGWEEFQKRQFFRAPKLRRDEDTKVLIFTPGVDRKTVILAKFAAALTWFMSINLVLTGLLFIYFLAAVKVGIATAFIFLLLNGLAFAVVNFLFIVPLYFYFQEINPFLAGLTLLVPVFLFYSIAHFLRETLLDYPLIFISLTIPLSILTGWLFFTLYQKKYLKNDLE